MEQNDIKTETSPQDATTVGMFLKYTRQSQKKSIETVSKALCIRKIYIKAIEENNFDELPPIPYGIGFVRSYSEFLGLNAERIVQCYKEEAMPKKQNVINNVSAKPRITFTIPSRKQILISISLALGIYFIALAVRYNDNTTLPQEEIVTLPDNVEETISLLSSEENKEENEEIIEENIPQSEIQDSDITEADNNQAKETKIDISQPEAKIETVKNKVVLKFKGESWLEVKDNEKVLISGNYPKGFVYEMPDSPNLILSVGRYFNVDVFINDKLTNVAGPKKQTNINIDKFLNH